MHLDKKLKIENGKTFFKKAREEWLCYSKVIGCAVDDDMGGYFINSDGSKTLTGDYNSAMILLFSRTLLAEDRDLTFINKLRCKIAKFIL